jgi:hypothetical protein
MNMEENVNVSPVRPGVITWFSVYCWILCIMYFVVMAVAIIMLVGDPAKFGVPAAQACFQGVFLLLVGGIFFAAGLLPLLLRPRPWLWVYDLIVICLGLTSCCFWPICIPLIIFWIRPEVKQYFGRPQ